MPADSTRVSQPEQERAAHPWIYRAYRRFCRGIYGFAAPFYDLVADTVSMGQWQAWLVLAKDRVPKGRVLELGFGTGRLQALLSADETFEVHGLELSLSMQKQCHQRMNRSDKSSYRVCGDGQRLPYADRSFDGVVASFPEEYIVSESCLVEMERVLRDEKAKVVVLGRWISLNSPLLQAFFPVFYRRPSEEEIQILKEKTQSCGLKCEVEILKLKWVTHYLLHLSRNQ